MRLLIVTLFLGIVVAQYYDCITQAFNGNCKGKLYACTNDPQCSYQLNMNTKHIFLDKDSTYFPPLYFSEQKAITLYDCLRDQCKLPPIDTGYPKTLPFDACLLQVYDECGGDIEQIFQNPQRMSPQAQCYRKQCKFPTLSTS